MLRRIEVSKINPKSTLNRKLVYFMKFFAHSLQLALRYFSLFWLIPNEEKKTQILAALKFQFSLKERFAIF